MKALWICVLGVALLGCVADVETEEVAPEADGVPLAEQATSLPECQRACRNGQQAMEQFCFGLPDPRLKGSCWMAAKAGLAGCLGWCYLHYGD
jgi:hypothetical protein